MSAAQYLQAVALVAVTVVSVGISAAALRRLLLPAWSGPPARLAEVVVALTLLLLIAELLGVAHQFSRWPLVVVAGAGGLASLAVQRVSDRPRGCGDRGARKRPTPSSGLPPIVLVLAFAVAPFAAAVEAAAKAFHGGMLSYDTLWYHMPFAASFVQARSLTGLLDVGNAPTTFYPANSEVFHATGILLLGNDALSPLLNLGWLALALLAGWCVGRPYGVAPATLVATALVMFLPVMGAAQVGTASTDIAALALLVASVALLVNGRGTPGAVVVAALAAGLAAGTKLDLWAPVIALGVVAVAAADRGRAGTAVRWTSGVLLGSAFWYVRNWVEVGNPFPWFGLRLGGLIDLPLTTAPSDCGRTSLADVVGNTALVRAQLLPALPNALGGVWWLVVGAAGAGAVAGVVLFRDPLLRGIALVAIVSAAAYVLTPATAGGANARCFEFNTRFAAPALALGLLLLPVAAARRPGGRLLATAALAAAALASMQLPGVGGALAVAVLAALVLAAGSSRTIRSLSRRTRVSAVLAGLVLAGLAGWHEQGIYLRSRYAASHFSDPIDVLAARFRSVRGARVAVDGIAESYPLYGLDLSDRVAYLARREDASYVTPATCAAWVRALRSGRYDFVVVANEGRVASRQAAWTAWYPGARLVFASGPGAAHDGVRWQWQLFRLGNAFQANAAHPCRRSKPTATRNHTAEAHLRSRG